MKISLKYIYFITTLLFIYSNSYGQSFYWQWASTAGGIEFEYSSAIKSDAFGNTYVVGHLFSVTASFGNIILNNTDPTGSGSDAFLAKFNPLGNILWVRSIGGLDYEYASDLTIDQLGYIYVSGHFQSQNIVLGNYQLLNPHGTDAFIVKYDANGNVVWANNISCTSTNAFVYSNGIGSDEDGNVYITGQYSSDTLLFGNMILTNSFFGNYFIAKYDSSGNPLWASISGGIRNEEGNSITCDSDNNVYVSGIFSSDTIYFGSDTLFYPKNDTLLNDRCAFLIKYDPSGTVLWSKNIAGVSTSSALKNDGTSIFWAGTFRDSSLIDGTMLNASLYHGIFIIKFSTNGQLVWATSPQGAYSASCNDLSIDSESNIYITGDFSDGPIIFDTTTLTRSQASNIYIAKYDSTGHSPWAMKLSGWNEISGRGISNDAYGNVYLTGFYRSTDLYFDSIIITNNVFGSSDIFIAKLHQSLVSVNELSLQNTVLIYPNPSCGNIIVRSVYPINSIRVVDINGRQIQSSLEHNNNIATVKILLPGVYIVHVYGDKNVFISKLIVQQ